MPRTTFVLTRQNGDQISRAETIVDISGADLQHLITRLKASQPHQFGELAMVYVAPEQYTLHVDGQTISSQPQFFPSEYGFIINELVSKRTPADA